MKNYIILQIQGYKPTNPNLNRVWDLMSSTSTDYDIRKRLDPSFDFITLESDDGIQEIAFQIAFNSLVYHFRTYCGSNRIKDFDVMNYTYHNYSYRIAMGRNRISYFDKLDNLPTLEIKNEESHG